MKRFILFAREYCLLIFFFPLASFAQDSTIVYPNYVVIGAFAIQENAVEFNDHANKNKLPAKFEMNPTRNLYYVYVLTTDDRSFAFEEARKLRTDTKYFDTWVYSGPLGENRGLLVYRSGASYDFNPETGAAFDAVNVRQANDTHSRVGGNVVATTSTASGEINRTPSSEQKIVQGRNKGKDKNTAALRESHEVPAQGNAHTGTRSDENKQSASHNPNQPSNKQGAANEKRLDAAKNSDQASQQSRIDDALSARKMNQGTTQPNEQSATKQRPQPQAGPLKSSADGSTQTQAAGPNQKGTDTATADTHEIESNVISSDDATQRDESAVAHNVPSINTSGLTETGKKAIAENIAKVVTLGPAPVRATTQPLTKEEVAGKDFYFYLYRGDNLATVDGEVDAIDFEKARRMATYQGNAPVKVTMASGNSKQISFVCQVFGYRKQQREYDPASPTDDLYLDKKGNLVVPFELARLQKGDIAIMYNVFFFKDAAVMRPESRFEVNNLLAFLVENPSYKIMIHGHTNGSATGKIIRMDIPGNFYTLSGTKQGFGSAKQLSEERANVIREFLIASGISPARMGVRAWGGKKPIHDKHSVRANENVRVEIEILSQ